MRTGKADSGPSELPADRMRRTESVQAALPLAFLAVPAFADADLVTNKRRVRPRASYAIRVRIPIFARLIA